MNFRKNALEILQETSRTFFIPISRLPEGLQEAVASAYLCMRAIDEIEDHPDLDNALKTRLLTIISLELQSAGDDFTADHLTRALADYRHLLPEVSYRVGEWALLAPSSISPRIWDATAAMADRMAYWAAINWQVQTEADLDRYTFSVAGAVGLMLSDLWAWYDGTRTDRYQAIGFGRGLQAVNILRNHREDMTRGVNFFPDGWSAEDVHAYARRNLSLADAYAAALPKGPALDFCQIPLMLAHATLDSLMRGEEKLSRSTVIALIEQITAASRPVPAAAAEVSMER
ncbi:phytoene/squalene synthase family protein [Leptolyngbya sp. 'hensonii']|uniref:squalene/phytoene synthase family protein n=1 Tax=Leptolyngbya sp. 'hensonii' TaxID=1922337 RepID=UPI0009502DE2|nr:phytoene/squalene synthase family protein [Leptolyngbya sp. 'hensonii']OLP16116.1 phytoene/squalene synthase family protein [Leptolyngbya sp. 'hensonii']